MADCCCAEACTAAVLIGVTNSMHLPGCPFDCAWCLVCEVCRLTVDLVDRRCFLSFVFIGGRRLELSPCNTLAEPPILQKFGIKALEEGSGRSFAAFPFAFLILTVLVLLNILIPPSVPTLLVIRLIALPIVLIFARLVVL